MNSAEPGKSKPRWAPRLRAALRERLCGNLLKERARLIEQRDALETERNDLARHGARLATEIDEGHGREAALRAEVQRLERQRDTLEAERDSLRKHAERLAAVKQQPLWAPPGHFYSPLVDASDPFAARPTPAPEEVCGFDERRMLSWLEKIATHYAEIPFPEGKAPGFRYWFDNPAFAWSDAITLFGFLRELKPRRVIEVGSGFSSGAMMDINDRFFDGAIELTFIDPEPATLLGLLDECDRYRSSVRAVPLQDVPLAEFARLEENDVLFLDSSHVLKAGSDVNDYLFRVLPALNPGVVVQIHDIFYAFDYLPEWKERSWNEVYALRAFLAYNRAFEILFWNDYVYKKRFRTETERVMPLCLRNFGGSLWIRKT